MFKVLHKQVKIVIWALVVTFMLWGATTAITTKASGPNYAGILYGKKISIPNFQNTIADVRSQLLLSQWDDQELRRMFETLNFNDLAWQRLLLLTEGRREGIRVSNQELISFIQRLPFFQVAGRFDQRQYEYFLKYRFGRTPRDFEEFLRRSLMIQKLEQKVAGEAAVTDEALKEEYRREFEKRKISYFVIEAKDFLASADVAESELRPYYNAHRLLFKKPDQLNLEYIALDAKDTDLTGKIMREPDWTLEKLSKNYKLPLQTTGLFSASELIPGIGLSRGLVETALALPVGEEFKQFITVQDTYYLIKVIARKPAHLESFDEAKEKIRVHLTFEKAHGLAARKAEEPAGQWKNQKNIESATINYHTIVDGIGQNRAFAEAAFGLQKGEISKPVHIARGSAVARCDEIYPPDWKKFEKEAYRKTTLARRRARAFLEYLQSLPEKANLKKVIE